tara:strand:- start:2987 stop:3766 length:780 start_codon:yes stop_codon:yes gene_type:complete
VSIDVFFDAYTLQFLLLASLFAMLGGFVKGAVGFALPLIAVSGISSIASPQEAVAAIIIPTFVSNIYQASRQGLGPALATAKQFWKFNLVLVLVIAVVTQLVPRMPNTLMFIILGTLITLAALIQLLGLKLPPPKTRTGKAGLEVGAGLVAGGMGGLGGFWGPPTVMYLIAIEVEKHAFIRAQGLIYMVGSIMLVGGHLTSGVLNSDTIPLSFFMLLPVAIGMGLGVCVHDKLDQKVFKKLVLIVLCAVGLNLLRRGFF